MLIELSILTGLMFGFELVTDYEDANHLVVDLGIVRLLLSFPKGEEFEV